MTYPRLHSAAARRRTALSRTARWETIPETYLFPGVEAGEGAGRPGVRLVSSEDSIASAERGLDHAQERLNNLRDLVERFGLNMHDEGPRAA